MATRRQQQENELKFNQIKSHPAGNPARGRHPFRVVAADFGSRRNQVGSTGVSRKFHKASPGEHRTSQK